MRVNNKEARLRVFATAKGDVRLIPGWNEEVDDAAWAEARKTKTTNGFGKEISIIQSLIDAELLEEGGASPSGTGSQLLLPTQVSGEAPPSGKSASDNPSGRSPDSGMLHRGAVATGDDAKRRK